MQNFLLSKKTALLLVFTIFLLGLNSKLSAQISISIIATINGNINTGTFSSTGLYTTTGNYMEEVSFNGKKAHGDVTFTDANGTFSAKTHSDISFSDATTATGTGTWKISGGTGLYAGIKGSGTLTLIITNFNAASNTGNILQTWAGTNK